MKVLVTEFLCLYREHFDFVWTVVRRLGVGPAAVDDVVQEVFIVIHSRLHTLERPDALRSWIYGIARRVVNHYHRAQRTRLASAASLSTQVELFWPQAPFDVGEQNDKVRLLQQILGQLDEAKREVFTMAELDELTVPEIAEVLQIPLNTAYSRLRAARKAFETALAAHQQQHAEEEGACQI